MDYQMTALEELECIYCELHKDVYGVKARWYKAANEEEARLDIARLQEAGEEIWAQEKKAEEEAAARFEQRVLETIRLGAGNRKTAMRWIHQAEETGGDEDFLCYQLGLPWRYFRKVA